MSVPFEVEEEVVGSVRILRFNGDLTSTTLQRRIGEFQKWEKVEEPAVLADFEQVAMMDSTGIAAVVRMYKNLSRENRNFAICKPSRVAKQVIEMVGLNNKISMFSNEKEAIEYLEAERKA